MKAGVNIRINKAFITSKEQLTTSSGYLLDSYESKKIWYRSIAKDIYNESQILCPVDKGYLKRSGRIKINSDGTYRVEYKELYAMYVHELIGTKHKQPTQAKFLEDAAYIVLSKMRDITGEDTPAFTFHLDMSIVNGIALYIDNISMDKFLGWVKETNSDINIDNLG